MTALRLWWRLSRHQRDQRLPVLLALVGFAVATGVLLTTLGGALALSHRDVDAVYDVLALAATVIVVVPVLTLGGSAARLAVSRRNARFAALRLAGATSGQVATIAVVDAAAQALVGALAGVVLYLGALPGVALIRFQGRPFRWSELWVGPSVLALSVLGVVLLATVSAAVTLASVVVGPLGVARRTTPKRLTVLRVVVAVTAFALWVPLMNGGAVALVTLVVVVGLCFGTLNLVGPFVLRLVGRVGVRRARDAAGLLAARRLLDDPRAAWRSVSGVTLATFVAGLMSAGPALSGGLAADPTSRMLGHDVLTGSVVTLVIAALVAAASSGVTQAARVLDQREQYRMLHLAGTDLAVLERARLRETGLPLVSCVLMAAAASLVIVAPVGLGLITSAWQGGAIFVGGVLAALGLVIGAVRLSQPLVALVVRPEPDAAVTA